MVRIPVYLNNMTDAKHLVQIAEACKNDVDLIKERQVNIMCLVSQEMRKLAPELDPLRIGTGWKKEDLGKVQVMVESTYGDSHPGSGHLNILVEEVRKGIAEEGGYGARYYCTDICEYMLMRHRLMPEYIFQAVIRVCQVI